MGLIRRFNDIYQEILLINYTKKIGDKFVLAFEHPENADGGDVVANIYKAPARMIIDSVKYVNPTGLAAHAANFGILSVLQGATLVALWSTEVGQAGTLTADTYVDLGNAVEADRIIEAGEEITLSVNESGTTTVPAGRVEINCRFIEDDVLFRVHRAIRKARIKRVDLRLLDGLVASDTNFYTFRLMQNAIEVASWDTRAANEGAMTADTFHPMTLSSTDLNRIIEAGELLQLDCDESGDAILSDIELVIHGIYV